MRLASVAQAPPLLAATASAARVRAATVFRTAEAGRGRPVPARPAHGSREPFGSRDRSLRSPGAAVRAGAANAGGEKRAFRLVVRDPRWVPNPARPSRCRRVLLARVPPAHADRREPLPVLSGRSVITRRRMIRCPPGPCRCWAAAPVWSGPRAAEPRVVECQRRSPKQETGAAIHRGESGLCDPRRSHADHRRISAPGICRPRASLLAATASAARVRAATVFRTAEAGRGRPVPARPAHGSGESIGCVTGRRNGEALYDRSCQCTIGRPATGARKQGMR